MSSMAREIAEQPAAVARLVGGAEPLVTRLAADISDVDVRWILIAARGSSDNAARYAQYLLGWRNRLPVALATPSLFTVYGTAPDLGGAAAVAISQSGRSPDVVAVLEAARDQGRPAIALTNDPDSPLAAAASLVVPLRAGPERAVAATKSYTTSLVALALLSAALELEEAQATSLAVLRELPGALTAAIEGTRGDAERFDRYAGAQRCVVVGRGLNYSTAFEVALKVRELTGIAAEAHSAADLLHGPIAALDRATPVVIVAPDEPSIASIRSVVPRLLERELDLIVLSNADDLLAHASTQVRLAPAPAPWLTPLTAVIPGQVMAHRLAECRGLDPDQPAGLSKVTRTR